MSEAAARAPTEGLLRAEANARSGRSLPHAPRVTLGQLVPPAPRAGVRDRLPAVVEVAVGADPEHLQAPVRVERRRDLAHPAAEAIPAAPRPGVRDGLPDVVERAVAADAEHLEPSVAVQRNGDVSDDA